MDEDNIILDFQKLIVLLAQQNINFVLIGGLAMILQGANTATFDIDITFAMDQENLDILCETINRLHPRPVGQFDISNFTLSPEIIRRRRFALLKTDLGGVDLLKSPSGVDSFEGIYKRASLLEVDGHSIRVASLDDLIAMKKAANRPKDQVHLIELYNMKKIRERSES